jgi:hypothetical protein
MTRKLTAIALGAICLASLAPLSAAHADTPAANATPSLAEPAPTPGWAEGGPAANRPAAGPQTTHPQRVRHTAWRSVRHRSGDNFLADAATGVVGGVADIGSVAAYPLYCFPNYGSCSVRMPYRF